MEIMKEEGITFQTAKTSDGIKIFVKYLEDCNNLTEVINTREIVEKLKNKNIIEEVHQMISKRVNKLLPFLLVKTGSPAIYKVEKRSH